MGKNNILAAIRLSWDFLKNQTKKKYTLGSWEFGFEKLNFFEDKPILFHLFYNHRRLLEVSLLEVSIEEYKHKIDIEDLIYNNANEYISRFIEEFKIFNKLIKE